MTKDNILSLISENLGATKEESLERYEYISMRIDNLPLDITAILYNIIKDNDYKKYSSYFKKESIEKIELFYKNEPSIGEDFDYIIAIINALELNLYDAGDKNTGC